MTTLVVWKRVALHSCSFDGAAKRVAVGQSRRSLQMSVSLIGKDAQSRGREAKRKRFQTRTVAILRPAVAGDGGCALTRRAIR